MKTTFRLLSQRASLLFIILHALTAVAQTGRLEFRADTMHIKKSHLFEIAIPHGNIDSSLYSSIDLLDTRQDTSDIGLVWRNNIFDTRQKILPATPLREQVRHLLDS